MWRPAKQGSVAVGNVQPGEPVCHCDFILVFLLVRFTVVGVIQFLIFLLARFAVVGVMEQFETSIAMMEAILPRFASLLHHIGQ